MPENDTKPAAPDDRDPERPEPSPPAAPPDVDPKQTRVAAQWKHAAPFVSCRFDPTGRFAIAGDEVCKLHRFEVATGKRVELAGGHDSWVRGMTFTADGALVTAGYDGRLVWWPLDAERPEPLRTVDPAHEGWVRWVAASPDGTLLATGGNDRLVKLWDAADGRPVRALAGHEGHVYSTVFDPGGRHVLSGDLHGHIRQWEVATGQPVRTLEAKPLHHYDKTFRADYGGVREMAFSPDGARLACAGLHKCTNAFAGVNHPLVVLFDWASGKVQRSYTAGIKGVAWGVRVHPAGFAVAATGGGSGGFLLFWQGEQAKPIHQLKLPQVARGLDLHPDGVRLLTAHGDRHLRVWEMAPPG